MSQLPTPPEGATKKDKDKEGIPQGLWMRCPDCGDMLFRKVVEEALSFCPIFFFYFRLGARPLIVQLFDPGSFVEMFEDIELD